MMRTGPTSDLWWKNAIVYCLDVETYHDADGDGCGDMVGLIERVDHAARLGATCLWLMPFYPTPNRDDGYDVADYLAVDPRLGDLGDVPDVIRHARDRGLRVIVDLVVNHTSDQHPWFRAARADRSSPFRDYYVWSDDPESEAGTTPDKWTWDEAAGQYYNHSFAPFQPDLNIAKPAVRDEIAKIVGFWLTLGASGFRMDAVPFLVEEVNARGIDPDDGKRWLHDLREYAMRRSGEAMLMGEANVAMDDIESFFEDHGDALHLQLGFLINQRLWLALARGEARPLEDLIRRPPAPPAPPASGPSPGAGPCPARRRLGDLPAQPRRAHARQARAGRARRGLRGLRAAGGHADLRPRDPPPGRLDAGRRRPAPAPGVVAAVLAAGHAGDALRRRGRHGRGPRARGPDERAHADALGPRGRSAAHARLAAARRAPSRPPAPRDAGARLGRQHADRERARGALRAPLGLAGIDGVRRAQPVLRARRRRARSRRGGHGRRRPARAARPPRGPRPPARRARRLRLPVAAGGAVGAGRGSSARRWRRFAAFKASPRKAEWRGAGALPPP